MRGLNSIRLYSLIIVFVLCLLVLTGCDREGTDDIPHSAGAYRIYCADKAMTELKWEYYEPVGTETYELAKELMGRMEEIPANELYRKVITDNVSVKTLILAGSDMIVDFTGGYSNLDRVAEVMLRAATVLTLCQVDGIDTVEIYVEGSPLMLKADSEIGRMDAGSFIDNVGDHVNFRQEVEIPVYFAGSDGSTLISTVYRIESSGYLSLEELALKQLISGPIPGQADVRRTVDGDCEVLKLTVRDGMVYVDFSKDFTDAVKGVSAEATVYSVVNTLTSIPSINKVVILVEGSTLKSLGGVSFPEYLEFRADLANQ